MDPIKTRMRLERETKGTYVFVNDKDDAPISTLYVNKGAFPDGVPKSIRIVITPKEE